MNVRKMYSTVERMDGCEYSIEIIIVPSREHTAGTNVFLEIKILLLKEILKQSMAASSVRIITVTFKEWINVILSVTKADTLLQGMDGCN